MGEYRYIARCSCNLERPQALRFVPLATSVSSPIFGGPLLQTFASIEREVTLTATIPDPLQPSTETETQLQHCWRPSISLRLFIVTKAYRGRVHG